jgi:hypothetical protein
MFDRMMLNCLHRRYSCIVLWYSIYIHHHLLSVIFLNKNTYLLIGSIFGVTLVVMTDSSIIRPHFMQVIRPSDVSLSIRSLPQSLQFTTSEMSDWLENIYALSSYLFLTLMHYDRSFLIKWITKVLFDKYGNECINCLLVDDAIIIIKIFTSVRTDVDLFLVLSSIDNDALLQCLVTSFIACMHIFPTKNNIHSNTYDCNSDRATNVV